MKINNLLTDDALLSELGERLTRLRVERNLTQAQLAEQAGVAKRTVERLEKGTVSVQLTGFLRVCRVLELLDRLELFVPIPAPSPIAQVKMHLKERHRAYTVKKSETAPPKKWEWGDAS